MAGRTLAPGPAGLTALRETVLALRRAKAMVVDPHDPDSRSCGSFFVNPIVGLNEAQVANARLGSEVPGWPVAATPLAPARTKLSAAWLIEHSGMGKGYGEGRVGLSAKHTLALVNRGGATAAEVLAFARHVQERVAAASGIRLQQEPVVLRQN